MYLCENKGKALKMQLSWSLLEDITSDTNKHKERDCEE